MLSKIVSQSGMLGIYERIIRPFGYCVIKPEVNFEGHDVDVSYSETPYINVNALEIAFNKSVHKVYGITAIQKYGENGVSFLYVINDVVDERHKYETTLR